MIYTSDDKLRQIANDLDDVNWAAEVKADRAAKSRLTTTPDKFPEEMLDDIREYAVKARDAAHDLVMAVCEMRRAFQFEDWYHEARWWQSVAQDFEGDADYIRDRIEEIFDEFYVEDETAEGGEK